MDQVRLRDFVEDEDGLLYAVSTYDNSDTIGCVLRYVPEDDGERVNPEGRRYTKYDFDDAYAFIARNRPQYAGLLHRIPYRDAKKILKPERELTRIARDHPRVRRLIDLFGLPAGSVGCTGSLLCQLDNETSDIDMVIYGKEWFRAQRWVRDGILEGKIEGLSPDMWRKIYNKRRPEIPYDHFVLHELRKWNRGQIEGSRTLLLHSITPQSMKLNTRS
ncbi:DNA polymerase subunit beta [Pelomyxa schiedti]|nr:DNA polymerase subunit beta [Pelomyxa schiedti]